MNAMRTACRVQNADTVIIKTGNHENATTGQTGLTKT
jgi:hypothetical protein